jgi:transcriptional regulator with XRE-family HTH domain
LLSEYRARKDLTLEALAAKAKVSPSYISLLIRGKKGRPKNQIIERLAQALELTEAEKLDFQAAAEASKVDTSANKLAAESSLNQLRQDPPSQFPDDAGIQAVHRSLSRDLLEEHFLKANKLVRIQENWLQDLFTYNSLFRDMLKTTRPELDIQVLLLDPNSSLAKIREKALNMPKEGYLSDQINSAIEIFRDIYKDNKSQMKSMEMRLFNVLPSVQHIAFDETIFIGFYNYMARSQSKYQLQIQAGSDLGNFFEEDFKKVWGMAKRVI